MSSAFKEVHFDRRVHIAQIPQVFEPRDAPSPASDQFNPLGWDRVAEYRGKIVNLIKGFKSMTYVTPTDSKWPEEYDIRQIRGDYTLQSDWPTTGHGAVVAVLDTGEMP